MFKIPVSTGIFVLKADSFSFVGMATTSRTLTHTNKHISPQTRAMPIITDKVFIEHFENAPRYNFEYSNTAPAALGALLDGFYGAQNYLELFYSLPEIFAPVHEIASRVADADWQLRKDWNDEVDFKDADFNRLFTAPNPVQDFKTLVYWAVVYEILTGKQFFYLNRPDTLEQTYFNTLSWFNLPANAVTIEQVKEADIYSATEIKDLVKRYTIPGTERGTVRAFSPNNVLPVLHPNPSIGFADLNRCMPLIAGAERAIKNLIPVYEARGTIYIKRGEMGFIVNRSKDASGSIPMTPEEKQELERERQNLYGLQRNKAQFGVTSANVDFVRTSMSIQELQPFDETLADAVAIYATLRVPPHLVPRKDHSTFANAEADMKGFYQDVIHPWAKRYAQIFENGLKLKDFRRYIFPDYSHVTVLQENKKENADTAKVEGSVWLERWKAGVCTLNDWIMSFEGTKGVGSIYEKKIYELTPEEKAAADALVAPPAKPEDKAAVKKEVKRAVALAMRANFDPSQPRDEEGKWTDSGDWKHGTKMGADTGEKDSTKPAEQKEAAPADKLEPGEKGAVKKNYPDARVRVYNEKGLDDFRPVDLDTDVQANAEVLRALESSGVPKNFTGNININKFKRGTIEVEASGDYFDMTRTLDFKNKVIVNEYLEIGDQSPWKGKGADIFNSQVTKAREYGFKTIEVQAAGRFGGQYNGYYTWARLGYAPAKGDAKDIYEIHVTKFNSIYGTNAKSLQEMMGTKTGQKYWKENGEEWIGEFDLNKDSYSSKTLKNYMSERSKR